MADEVVPTLTVDVNMLTPILGMPLNFLKDVIVLGLRGFSSLGFFLLLASLGPLLSLAALRPRHHNWTFPPSHGVWQTTLLCAWGGS
jgi:hypothetical protein